MHLGLIDGPFVPHNLIRAQESPVPLPRYQMALRIKILMSSGSKKLTQIYYPFHSKVPSSESPPGSPTGPCGERCLYPEPFLTYLLGSPVKGPSALRLFREKHFILRAPFICLLKSLVDEHPSWLTNGPLWKEMPVSRAFGTYPPGSPAREPSLHVPFTELP